MAQRKTITQEDIKITLEWLMGEKKLKDLSNWWGQRPSSPSPYIIITRTLKEARKQGFITINRKAYD